MDRFSVTQAIQPKTKYEDGSLSQTAPSEVINIAQDFERVRCSRASMTVGQTSIS
jgi:hypothetical protein